MRKLTFTVQIWVEANDDVSAHQAAAKALRNGIHEKDIEQITQKLIKQEIVSGIGSD